MVFTPKFELGPEFLHCGILLDSIEQIRIIPMLYKHGLLDTARLPQLTDLLSTLVPLHERFLETIQSKSPVPVLSALLKLANGDSHGPNVLKTCAKSQAQVCSDGASDC